MCLVQHDNKMKEAISLMADPALHPASATFGYTLFNKFAIRNYKTFCIPKKR